MTKSFVLLLGFIALAGLSGCATAPLVPVTYDRPVETTSSLPAVVELETGVVTGHSTTSMAYAGGIVVPVASGPQPHLQFGEEDQRVFVESLKQELGRHRLVRVLEEMPNSNGLEIRVLFAQTEHFPNMNEYKITAALSLRYDELQRVHRYEILSSDGETLWRKLNTSASQGKKLAAEKLLQALLPDIEAFVSEVLRASLEEPIAPGEPPLPG